MFTHRSRRVLLQTIFAAFLVDYVVCKTPVHVLGLFPMSGPWAGGEALYPATQLAIQDVNADPDIMKDYHLNVVFSDTKCDGGHAVDAMFRELYNKSVTKVMVLGCGCSASTLPTAAASHLWNLIQLSYGAYSPALSQRSVYPLFFRMVTPESTLNLMKIEVLKYFSWMKVATINPPGAKHEAATADLREKAERVGIKVIVSETFTDDPTFQVANIKKQGARIILGRFYAPEARKVFCRAYHEGMYGAKYVWIIPGYYQHNWWSVRDDDPVNCTVEEMRKATEGYFGIHVVALPEGDEHSRVSGLSSEKYEEKYNEFVNHTAVDLVGIEEAPFGYDGVWTIALALDKADKILKRMDPPESIVSFDYDSNSITKLLFEIMSNTSFEGVTGAVKFTDTGDRIGPMQVEQNQDGIEKVVGIYDPARPIGEEFYWTTDPEVKWLGDKPPVDAFIEERQIQRIHLGLFILITVLAVCGILVACFFLAFNLVYRGKQVIKMSSPNLNNLILAGGVIVYLSTIFAGVDTNLVNEGAFCDMAVAFTWFLSIGFSISFGAMFSKIYRVHKIFTNASVVQPKGIQDEHLFGLVTVLVILDVIILSIWTIADPLTYQEQDGVHTESPRNDDIILIPVVITCTARWHIYFLGALLIIKGMLLIFGAFLAWETRHVEIPGLNDSKWIGMSIYTVVILAFTGLPVEFFVSNANANFALLSIFIIFPTTLTLCLVFVPKIIMRNDVHPVRHHTTVKIKKPGIGESDDAASRDASISISGNQLSQSSTPNLESTRKRVITKEIGTSMEDMITSPSNKNQGYF